MAAVVTTMKGKAAPRVTEVVTPLKEEATPRVAAVVTPLKEEAAPRVAEVGITLEGEEAPGAAKDGAGKGFNFLISNKITTYRRMKVFHFPQTPAEMRGFLFPGIFYYY